MARLYNTLHTRIRFLLICITPSFFSVTAQDLHDSLVCSFCFCLLIYSSSLSFSIWCSQRDTLEQQRASTEMLIYCYLAGSGSCSKCQKLQSLKKVTRELSGVEAGSLLPKRTTWGRLAASLHYSSLQTAQGNGRGERQSTIRETIQSRMSKM